MLVLAAVNHKTIAVSKAKATVNSANIIVLFVETPRKFITKKKVMQTYKELINSVNS
jgi:hypothetical protein